MFKIFMHVIVSIYVCLWPLVCNYLPTVTLLLSFVCAAVDPYLFSYHFIVPPFDGSWVLLSHVPESKFGSFSSTLLLFYECSGVAYDVPRYSPMVVAVASSCASLHCNNSSNTQSQL
ncbi:hypothetical protein AXF42_Ash021369 [Apostasia shenzhenica]|uniref:Uncharacterized protein n=1 Tax=Apostasia shenzhenica TaxID=1088818 RepID=A0A2H9ZW18_9ASPA|nr:hypothetical protein AXF42_Ash021369 [Apostasia shenzhenica]